MIERILIYRIFNRSVPSWLSSRRSMLLRHQFRRYSRPRSWPSGFLNGQRLALGEEDGIAVPAYQGRVRVYRGDKLLGTAILQGHSVLAPERLIAFKAE